MAKFSLEEKIALIDFLRECAVDNYINMPIKELTTRVNKTLKVNVTEQTIRYNLDALKIKIKKVKAPTTLLLEEHDDTRKRLCRVEKFLAKYFKEEWASLEMN